MSYAATTNKTHRTAAPSRDRGNGTNRAASCLLTSGRLETITLIVIVALLIAGALVSARPRPAQPGLSGFKVRPGDTFWTLAAAHPVDGLTTAEVADFIAEANSRESALLRPGETILVPVGSADTKLASR